MSRKTVLDSKPSKKKLEIELVTDHFLIYENLIHKSQS